jgi:putative DNA primase/helicase
MSQHQEILAEAFQSCLHVIAGAAAGKERQVFADWSRQAMGHAIKAGWDKVDAVDRLDRAGSAIGLNDGFRQQSLTAAVEFAEGGGISLIDDSRPVPAKQQSSKTLVVSCAADIVPEAIDWTWRNRIAQGKLALIAGEPGLGKSQLATKIVATETTAGDWPCGEGRAKGGSAMMLCAEDGAADTIVPRLMAAGADLKRVHIVSAVADRDRQGNRSFNLQADLDILENHLTRIADVRLIVIDPISSYMGKVDSHKNTDVRSVLEAAGEMASRRRVALLGITHFSKGGGQKAINQFIGSIAFIAAARTAYAVMADPEDETRRLFMPVKNNLAPMGKGLAFRMEQRLLPGDIVASSVAFEPEPVAGTADGILAANNDSGADKSARSEAVEFLRETLALGPRAATDIKADAEEAGQSWATIKRAKKQIGVLAERKAESGDGLGRDGRWYWRLPDLAAKGIKND